jgi:hypothetical protein
MTRDTKPKNGYRGNAKGSTGGISPSPLIPKLANQGMHVTVTED